MSVPHLQVTVERPLLAEASRSRTAGQRLTTVRDVRSSAAERERVVLRRALKGDVEALDVLFARQRSQLFRAAFGLLRNKEDAEDAVQDGLFSAYLHLSTFRGRSLFSTWLTRIIINAALMKRRKQKTNPETSLDGNVTDTREPPAETIASSDPDPEQLCAASEVERLVWNTIDQLSAHNRTVIQFRCIEGLSAGEAASSSGISLRKLKSRLFRARRQLADSLMERPEHPRRRRSCPLHRVPRARSRPIATSGIPPHSLPGFPRPKLQHSPDWRDGLNSLGSSSSATGAKVSAKVGQTVWTA